MSGSIKNIEIQTLKAVEAYFQNDKPNAAKLARKIGGPTPDYAVASTVARIIPPLLANLGL